MTLSHLTRPQPTSAASVTVRRGPRPGLVVGVLLLHVAGLWLMQQNLDRPTSEAVTPVRVLQALVESVQPVPAAKPEPAFAVAEVEKKQPAPLPGAAAKPQPVERTSPAPAPAISERPPVPAQPASSKTVAEPQPIVGPAPTEARSSPPSSPSSIGAGAAPAENETDTGVATTANESKRQADSTARTKGAPSPAVEQPVSNARHLNNAPPPYPLLSKRLGEQGAVVVLLRIGVNGTASHASVERSSGFERLDQAALKTALEWRYVPGTRAGVPEAMWFRVPVTFSLR